MSETVTLETFLGSWRDSLGNNVQVEWARSNNRGGQLDVALQKPRGYNDPIRLNVKRHPDGRFSCGHYDLDTDESRPNYIVWVDYRKGRRKSTWERDQSQGDNNSRSWEGSYQSDRDRKWEDRGNSSNDKDGRYGSDGGDRGNGDRDEDDSEWKDRYNRLRVGDGGWRSGRDDLPTSGVNSIPVRGPPYGRSEGKMSEDADQQGGFGGPDTRLYDRPVEPAAADRPAEPLMQPPPGAPTSGASLWSGGVTPGAWVPPSGPPPSVGAGGGGAAAVAGDGASGSSWRSLIEWMYRRFNPEKLQELDHILEKYKDRESDLYYALREKYDVPTGPGHQAMHPGMPPMPWGWPAPPFWPHQPGPWQGQPPGWPPGPPPGAPPGPLPGAPPQWSPPGPPPAALPPQHAQPPLASSNPEQQMPASGSEEPIRQVEAASRSRSRSRGIRRIEIALPER